MLLSAGQQSKSLQWTLQLTRRWHPNRLHNSTMDVDGLHKNEDSSPWMSQLFEKLDLEVDGSTEKMTSPENDANLERIHPAGEEYMSGQDNYLSCRTGDNTVNGFKSSTCPRCNKTLPVPHSVTPFRPLIGSRYPLPDVEAKEYYRMKKRIKYRGTHENENEMIRLSEECLLAFRRYVQIYSLEDTEYKFGELWCHSSRVQADCKIYQHFNFTMRTKLRNSDIWTLKLYFAEVKQLFGVTYYFCCPLDASDDGRCFECRRQHIGDLKHPRRGGYENGYSITLDSFMDAYSSDSDTDKDKSSSSVPEDHWLMFVS